MADSFMVSMMDTSRNASFDSATLLTTSTLNALHFPGLGTSGISDTGGGSRTTSFILDSAGMCESMTESFCSMGHHDDAILVNQTNTIHSDASLGHNFKMDRKDSITQKKRRSRKSQYDASMDVTFSLDKIESVNVFDEQLEDDDAWLCKMSQNEHHLDVKTDNIFSWVHKEFKTNDVKASKHLLLCKLDDMSNARTIRSLSCHNFAENQKSDLVKRSLTDQQVKLETITNGRLHAPLLYDHINTRSISPDDLSPLRVTITDSKVLNQNENNNNNDIVTSINRSRETSKDRERKPMNYTDLEVIAKVQLENLRQAERQTQLLKQFSGSNASLASNSSAVSAPVSSRTGNKPPVPPKAAVTRTINSTKSTNNRPVNVQTTVATKANSYETSTVIQTKPSLTTVGRASVLPPSSTNNNRTRPVTVRPISTYRGSQTPNNPTTSNNINGKTLVTTSSSVPRNGKKVIDSVHSTVISKQSHANQNGLLNDVSNKPVLPVPPIRSQTGPQRRTMLPHSSTYSSVERISSSSSTTSLSTNRQSTIPRSSSTSLSQGRKSGIPTVGKQQSSSTVVTRPASSNIYQSSQSSGSMVVTRTVQGQHLLARPAIVSWNEGCY